MLAYTLIAALTIQQICLSLALFHVSCCWVLAQVERIVSERAGASRCLLVKWEGLPYCECTWETEAAVMTARGGPEARDDFLTRQQRLQEPSKGVHAARSSFISSKRSIAEMSTQPAFLTGGQLRDYQLEGINWLTYAWIKVE